VEISFRDLITVLHGMGFGALFMLAFSGAFGVIYAAALGDPDGLSASRRQPLFRFYLVSMAVLAWLTVLSGSYLVYPWYRAKPPTGTTDLSGYPQRLLLSSPLTAGWHDYGMEWKEHVAWLAPIAMTMVAYVFIRYGPRLARHRRLRDAVLGFTAAAFLATAVAGVFGAFLNKTAPVKGGPELVLMRVR
jgi:purine-cytosine permease-like protein